MQVGHSVALRFTELFSRRFLTLRQLTTCHEESKFIYPIDSITDCQDLFDNVAGTGVLPQDKAHRTYVLALREELQRKGFRLWIKAPTESMLADGLTKSMLSMQLLTLLRYGFYLIENSYYNDKRQPKLVRIRRHITD